MSTYAHIAAGIVDNIVVADAPTAAANGWVGPIDGLNPVPGIGWTYDGANFHPPAANPRIANGETIAANLQAHLNSIETWLAANPAGAVLTAAQTLFVAQTLAGLIRVVLGELGTVGQAN